MTVSLRLESPNDAADVRAVVAAAFSEAEHSAPPMEGDGSPGEATLVGWLRESDAYDPRFAFVAEEAGTIVGYAVATWGEVDKVPVLGIGPLAVLPAFQGAGIGAQLMEAMLAAAQRAGERVVVLLGDPAYYARFGFVPASTLGITSDPAWGAFFQACALNGDAARNANEDAGTLPQGTYSYAEPFSKLG